jgi:hypothetical protein
VETGGSSAQSIVENDGAASRSGCRAALALASAYGDRSSTTSRPVWQQSLMPNAQRSPSVLHRNHFPHQSSSSSWSWSWSRPPVIACIGNSGSRTPTTTTATTTTGGTWGRCRPAFAKTLRPSSRGMPSTALPLSVVIAAGAATPPYRLAGRRPQRRRCSVAAESGSECSGP